MEENKSGIEKTEIENKGIGTTSVNDKVAIEEPDAEAAKRGAEAVKKMKPTPTPPFDPEKAAESLKNGILSLKEPIYDGEMKYTELAYDFSMLRGLELARALDAGGKHTDKFAMELSDEQALNCFAWAAAKCQEQQGGLDVRDIRERIGGADAIKAIQIAICFFRFTSLAGDMRLRKM